MFKSLFLVNFPSFCLEREPPFSRKTSLRSICENVDAIWVQNLQYTFFS